jgi:hypothetical protein
VNQRDQRELPDGPTDDAREEANRHPVHLDFAAVEKIRTQ